MRQAIQCRGTIGQNFGVRRQALAGQHVERGQEQRRGTGIEKIAKRAQRRQQRFGLLIAVGDQDLRKLRFSEQQRRVDCLRGERESGEPQDRRCV